MNETVLVTFTADNGDELVGFFVLPHIACDGVNRASLTRQAERFGHFPEGEDVCLFHHFPFITTVILGQPHLSQTDLKVL